MPANRMEGALFFASKYKIEEVRYHPLPNIGPIARGVFCVKTEKGWIINGHLSAGSSSEIIHLRSLQVEEIAKLCKELSEEGKVSCFVCIDSNIKRTGKVGDEYSSCGLSKHFINSIEEDKPFILTADNATCTNCLTSAIRGEKEPLDVEEGFEHIDCILSYKSSNADIKMKTKIIPGYHLDKQEVALSDHNILVCEASWK
ncbi:MAG: hypothetical protein JSS09_09000 [Verrucomicrobia bacterium]|nr:hypothetical protein [Verrucomicrobiota bacterium]